MSSDEEQAYFEEAGASDDDMDVDDDFDGPELDTDEDEDLDQDLHASMRGKLKEKKVFAYDEVCLIWFQCFCVCLSSSEIEGKFFLFV